MLQPLQHSGVALVGRAPGIIGPCGRDVIGRFAGLALSLFGLRLALHILDTGLLDQIADEAARRSTAFVSS